MQEKYATVLPSVQIILDNNMDHRAEVTVLLREPGFIILEEPLEIVKKNPVKHCVFQMTLPANPCHGRGVYS